MLQLIAPPLTLFLALHGVGVLNNVAAKVAWRLYSTGKLQRFP